jgi:hypothetical protein
MNRTAIGNKTAIGGPGRVVSLRNLILAGAAFTGLLVAVLAAGRWRNAAPGAPNHPSGTVRQQSGPALIPPARAATQTQPPRFVAGTEPARTANEAFLAQARGPGFQNPAEFYKKESRDPVWAGAMEARLGERFAAEKLKDLGIAGLKVDSTDCRTSTCQIEVSWTLEDLAALEKPGGEYLDPLSLLTWSTGPLAATEYRTKLVPGEMRVPGAWNVRRRSDGRFSTTTVVLFGDDDIDPSRYQERTALRRQARVHNPLLPR